MARACVLFSAPADVFCTVELMEPPAALLKVTFGSEKFGWFKDVLRRSLEARMHALCDEEVLVQAEVQHA